MHFHMFIVYKIVNIDDADVDADTIWIIISDIFVSYVVDKYRTLLLPMLENDGTSVIMSTRLQFSQCQSVSFFWTLLAFFRNVPLK